MRVLASLLFGLVWGCCRGFGFFPIFRVCLPGIFLFCLSFLFHFFFCECDYAVCECSAAVESVHDLCVSFGFGFDVFVFVPVFCEYFGFFFEPVGLVGFLSFFFYFLSLLLLDFYFVVVAFFGVLFYPFFGG